MRHPVNLFVEIDENNQGRTVVPYGETTEQAATRIVSSHCGLLQWTPNVHVLGHE